MNKELKYLDIPKYIKVLSLLYNIDNIRMADMFENIKLTYSHFIGIMRGFEKLGWVIMEKKGRDIHVVVTEKGKRVVNVATHFNDLVEPYLENKNLENKNESKQCNGLPEMSSGDKQEKISQAFVTEQMQGTTSSDNTTER